MLCDCCKKNPATVYVRRTVNGVTTEAHLCEQCAQEPVSYTHLDVYKRQKLFQAPQSGHRPSHR